MLDTSFLVRRRFIEHFVVRRYKRPTCDMRHLNRWRVNLCRREVEPSVPIKHKSHSRVRIPLRFVMINSWSACSSGGLPFTRCVDLICFFFFMGHHVKHCISNTVPLKIIVLTQLNMTSTTSYYYYYELLLNLTKRCVQHYFYCHSYYVCEYN